jgi:5,6,7,8-tetrahydromethanopterin hydro-lyase
MWIGEGFAGEGPDAAHINTVLGRRDGPVGTAWATALATPREGHVAFVCVHRPGLPVQPYTLFVNKAAVASEAHAALTWGAAQAGVAEGVRDALGAGHLDAGTLGDLVLIAAVWVDPEAGDATAVHANNRLATATALAVGVTGRPTVAELLDSGAAHNPWFGPPA